jgi:hypothetical protein
MNSVSETKNKSQFDHQRREVAGCVNETACPRFDESMECSGTAITCERDHVRVLCVPCGVHHQLEFIAFLVQGFVESHVERIDFVINWTIVFFDFSVCCRDDLFVAHTTHYLLCRSIAENNLTGTLPLSLGQLTALTHL